MSKKIITNIIDKVNSPEFKDFFMKKFKYSSTMQIPRLKKVVINIGIKKGDDEVKRLESSFRELYLITGQKPIITTAKKSIASFNLRKGQKIGCKVTLRKSNMYCFLDKLINCVFPSTSDFRGLNPNSFDGRGNYALGIKDQSVFPEIDYDFIKFQQGMDVIITTTAKTDEEGRELLKQINMPFRKN